MIAIKRDRLRDSWEKRAVDVMRQVYGNQAKRTLRTIRQLDNADEILRAIAELYRAEPNLVKRDIRY